MSIVQNFFEETLDENGCLTDIQATGRRISISAMTWWMRWRRRRRRSAPWSGAIRRTRSIFSPSRDIREQSNRAANALLEAGIEEGDRVMLALKRHYEYWFISVALHKIGAVMIPVTHMLTTEDFIYRIRSAKVKAVICTPMDEVPEKVKSGRGGTERGLPAVDSEGDGGRL